ncbi:MAG: Nramp family divalent metal transporter, partial [Chloroflexota bacterium]
MTAAAPQKPPAPARTRRAPAPQIPVLSRLRDRLESGDVLRLRGRFRGRPGVVAFLAVMGPGLIAGIAGNDAGGITTYSVVGATTGLALLWLFPITTVILAIVQEMAARLGVVTGQGLSDLIRDRFGVRWTVFAMLVLLVANVANTVAEFSGATAALEIFGVPRVVTVPLVAVVIWALVLFASYRTVERVFLATALAFAAYVVSAILARPDWGAVGQALVMPSIPSGSGILLLMVAVVGTTITPYMQFYLQSAVAEKGIGEEELRLERADAVGGAIWTNVIAVFIVISTAVTIHAVGGHIDTASDAARGLEPFAGQLATLLFATGL